MSDMFTMKSSTRSTRFRQGHVANVDVVNSSDVLSMGPSAVHAPLAPLSNTCAASKHGARASIHTEATVNVPFEIRPSDHATNHG